MAENLVHATKRIKWEKSWSSTHHQVLRHRHTWTINNFNCCSEGNGESLESPSFSAGTNNFESKWYLALYPQGYKERSNKKISLYLVPMCMKEIQAEYTLGIVNAEGKDVNSFTELKKFKNCNGYGKDNFLERDTLFKAENNFLSDDNLTIFCEITATVGTVYTSGTLTTPQSDLVKDFSFMLENEKWCDVILSTGGKEFPAHKFILRARSPVFRAMFQHDMEESKNNRVEITDIDEEGLMEMLCYMYTGEIHSLKEMAPRLLKMADKYQMDGLKIMCEKALLENLSRENAAETLILSETFCAAEVMDQVKDFIIIHAAEVGKTSGFESMVLTHPHLALEAFRACTK